MFFPTFFCSSFFVPFRIRFKIHFKDSSFLFWLVFVSCNNRKGLHLSVFSWLDCVCNIDIVSLIIPLYIIIWRAETSEYRRASLREGRRIYGSKPNRVPKPRDENVCALCIVIMLPGRYVFLRPMRSIRQLIFGKRGYTHAQCKCPMGKWAKHRKGSNLIGRTCRVRDISQCFFGYCQLFANTLIVSIQLAMYGF